MLLTEQGFESCRVVIVDSKYKTLYNEWFLTESPVVDYLTHVTGITKDILEKNAIKQYGQDDKVKL